MVQRHKDTTHLRSCGVCDSAHSCLLMYSLCGPRALFGIGEEQCPCEVTGPLFSVPILPVSEMRVAEFPASRDEPMCGLACPAVTSLRHFFPPDCLEE